jgi:hypothetical protein
VDPDGEAIWHTNPRGWGHHAPQRWFGYQDKFDRWAENIGYKIHGTRLNLGDVTIRMWKGRYGGSIGGEIGLYTAGEKGRSLNRSQLGEIGVISSSIQLFDKRDNSLIFEYTEEKPSYWTNAFKRNKELSKNDVYAVFTLEFTNENRAGNKAAQINDQAGRGRAYGYNEGETIRAEQIGNKVIIYYGKPQDKLNE